MYFTNQSQCGTSVPQWEPNDVIQLTNPSTGTITCLGYAYTCKRRCQRAIARGTISYAQSILESLATQDPMAAAKSDKLQDAAQMLLCYQHTSQLDRTVLTWSSQLRSHAGSTQSYSRVNDTRDSQTHKHSATSRDALLYELLVRMLKLEKELEESKRQRQSVPQFDEEQRKRREAEREAKVKREEKEEEEVLEERRKHAEEERKEKQRKETEAKERAERRERERREKEKQRQQEEQQRQKAETERRTREQAQERTWPEAWSEYIGRWEAIEKSSSPNELDFPWPTKSGLLKDVTETNVRQFFLKALPLAMAADPKEENYSLMTTENKRWHTDKILSRFGSDILEGPHKDRLNMIAKSVVDLWKRAKMERKL